MADIHLTLACGDYEITRALQDGSVKPDGIDLTVLTDIDSTTRHWRFLRNREFDVAEVSASSYLLARDAGWPIDAIPVFLHRRFRHEFVFVNTSKGIRTPKDLIGRKVGCKSFQASAILWMRGILESEYGVPHKSIDWYAELDEDVAFTPPPGLRLTTLPEDASLEKMLISGELDAVLHTDLIDPYIDGHPAVGRLFQDYKAEEMAFFQKTQIFPIMHVTGIKREIVEKHPWAPIELYKAFEKAKAAGMKRMFNPRVAPLAWWRHAMEEQERVLGKDPWEFGLTPRNRNNLETLIGYSHLNGMLSRKLSLDEIFLDVSQGRKRGTHRV
jgi:4,5-dihydroxyphthalate decarboxylase